MGKTVMIVDDSASMRQLVEFTLKEAGYTVVTAVNGRDGVGKAAGAKVDMVVTDLNMPEMDGLELIRQLRQMPSYKFTPIVMLTTESQDSKKAEGKTAGASGWIVKPFKPDQLLGLVQRFLR
jgi:two-component system chemotaxis response regulator CheY